MKREEPAATLGRATAAANLDLEEARRPGVATAQQSLKVLDAMPAVLPPSPPVSVLQRQRDRERE